MTLIEPTSLLNIILAFNLRARRCTLIYILQLPLKSTTDIHATKVKENLK